MGKAETFRNMTRREQARLRSLWRPGSLHVVHVPGKVYMPVAANNTSALSWLIPAEPHGVPSWPGKCRVQGQEGKGQDHRGATHDQVGSSQEGIAAAQPASRAEHQPLLPLVLVAVIPAHAVAVIKRLRACASVGAPEQASHTCC